MNPKSYAAYCKGRRRSIDKKPEYPHFRDSWGSALGFGICIGLIFGIWRNFFPLPNSLFNTIGAVMFTLFFAMAGATVGLICAPLFHFGNKLVILLKHRAEISARTKRLAQNPIIREILRYGAEKKICAIVITGTYIRLYNRIMDARYCEDETDNYAASSQVGLDTYEESFRKKEHWSAYDQGACREYLFQDAGFENLDDDTQVVLVNYLCKQLGDWGVAKHRAYAFYTETSGGGWNGELTFNPHTNKVSVGWRSGSFIEHTREFYSDYLVYHLETAYHAAQQQAEAVHSNVPAKW